MNALAVFVGVVVWVLADSFHTLLATTSGKHRLIKPHRPWQNGKVERFNRTLQIEWS